MEPNRDDQLISDLQALRPTPRPQFAAELDERAAAGFPRRSRLRLKLPSLSSRRFLIPAGGLAVIAIVVVTAVSIGGLQSNEVHLHSAIDSAPQESAPRASQASPEAAGAAALAAPERTLASKVPQASPSLHHRAVERSAEVTLAADPEDVADDVSKVFEAVHANNGIVMRSSTEEGRAGEAGATFDLLIPSGRLDDAMAAFSEIDAVRSRHEATADITAPTVTTGELLQDSKARIDSLLAQLEAAETESEREAVEAELRQERRHRTGLRARFGHLQRRADFSRVSLRIETGAGSESSGGGAWGIDDAFHDAGHVLTVAAAVTLISLAVLVPIALIALLAWLTHRAWVRRERRRVLS
jgi:Domain of unknown function (DUF4349)